MIHPEIRLLVEAVIAARIRYQRAIPCSRERDAAFQALLHHLTVYNTISGRLKRELGLESF